MKKILIIPSWYPTADNEIVGSFFKEQIVLLFKHGIDLRVVYISEKTVSPLAYYLKYGFKKKLDLFPIQQDPFYLEGRLTIRKKLKSRLKIKAFTTAYQKAFAKITADGWSPDIIHAFSTQNAGIIASKLHQKTGIPYYISEHNPIFFQSRKGFEKKAFENAQKTSVVSFHLLRHLLIQEIDANPVTIWNLVDEDTFQIDRKASQNPFTITTVSYPQKIKDMETFFKAIAAFSRLCDEPFKVIVVGNDNFADRNNATTTAIESLAKTQNAHQYCTFLPYVARENMVQLLNQTDVFVSSSISETFGLAAREAMLCGVPVISTKNGGIEDTLTSDNGLLVNLRDWNAIAKNILKIQKKELVFNPQILRQTVIEQSGKTAFLNNMRSFYNEKTIL